MEANQEGSGNLTGKFNLHLSCSQCDFDLFAMFDFLQTFACEPLSRIEGSQLESTLRNKETKMVQPIKRRLISLANKQSKCVRKCF